MDIYKTFTEFTTPINFDECERRLKKLLAIPENWQPTTEGHMSFVLYAGKNWHRDAFFKEPHLLGFIESDGTGTRVEVQYVYLNDPRMLIYAVIFIPIFLWIVRKDFHFVEFLLTTGLLSLFCIYQWINFLQRKRIIQDLDKQLRSVLSSTINLE